MKISQMELFGFKFVVTHAYLSLVFACFLALFGVQVCHNMSSSNRLAVWLVANCFDIFDIFQLILRTSKYVSARQSNENVSLGLGFRKFQFLQVLQGRILSRKIKLATVWIVKSSGFRLNIKPEMMKCIEDGWNI